MRHLAALALLLPAAAAAQPLTTDRPDFTESPLAVPTGRIQVEAGATVQETFQGGTFVNAPEALVRIGIRDGVEVRAALPDFTRFEVEATPRFVRENVTDPSVGVKVEIGEASGVALAIIAETTLPVIDDGVRPERAAQTVILTGGADLSPRLSLGSQVGATYNDTPEALDLAATLVLGVALDDQIEAFAEVAVDRQGLRASAHDVLLHAGATLLLTDGIQLDAHAGVGVSGAAPSSLIGVGVSARF